MFQPSDCPVRGISAPVFSRESMPVPDFSGIARTARKNHFREAFPCFLLDINASTLCCHGAAPNFLLEKACEKTCLETAGKRIPRRANGFSQQIFRFRRDRALLLHKCCHATWPGFTGENKFFVFGKPTSSAPWEAAGNHGSKDISFSTAPEGSITREQRKPGTEAN